MAKRNPSGNKSKERRRPNKALIAACILLGLLLAVIVAGFAIFNSYYGLSNYVSDSAAARQAAQTGSVEVEDTGLTEEEMNALIGTQTTARESALFSDKDIYSVLLIGVDRRDESWNGNSDSIILLSVNRATKKIHVTSFMRDLYAEIDGYGVRKLNSACAIGGPTLLVSTLEENYRVDINNYACVDYVSMAAIIDLLGSVTIEVNDEEAELANGLIWDMCNTVGIDAESHYYDHGAGTYEADGYMAVGYARVRHTGNADYERTERQRAVISQIMQKVRAMSTSELNSFVRAALPYVTHNIDTFTMLSLVSQIPTMKDYEVVDSRVPYDGLYTVQNELLVPEEPATIERLQQELQS